jgi:hypothetical protein
VRINAQEMRNSHYKNYKGETYPVLEKIPLNYGLTVTIPTTMAATNPTPPSFAVLLRQNKDTLLPEEYQLALDLHERWKDDTAVAYADDSTGFVEAVRRKVKNTGTSYCSVTCSRRCSLRLLFVVAIRHCSSL